MSAQKKTFRQKAQRVGRTFILLLFASGVLPLFNNCSKTGFDAVAVDGTLDSNSLGNPSPSSTTTTLSPTTSTLSMTTTTRAPPSTTMTTTTSTITTTTGAPSTQTSATFKADTTTELQNPERGYYFRVGPGEACTSVLTNVRDGTNYQQKVRLVYYEANPASFSASGFNADMACVRAAGMKIILGEVYCDTLGCSEGVTISQAESQLAAMATSIEKNKDVIAVVRIGAIGGWGEGATWAGNDVPADVRTRVRDAIIKMTPTEIPLVHRNPGYLQLWYSPITTATAFNGSDGSRVGMVNDCFLSQPDDHFTYPGPTSSQTPNFTTSAANQRAFAAAQTEFAPSGAETCDGGNNRLACSGGTLNDGSLGGIMNEGPRYHLNYMHRGYFDGYMFAWGGLDDKGSRGPGNCYDSVTNMMGYRFQYDSISHSSSVSRGGTLSITLNMHNYGWSRIFLERRVNVILVSGSSSISCVSKNDLRLLPSQSSTPTPITIQCNIPTGAAPGNYSVYLSMPDMNSSIAGVRAYFIQPANANNGGQTWNNTNGRFSTGTIVNIN